MYLWQRKAGLKWLAAHEARLQTVAGCHLAIISRPGRVRSQLQVLCRTRASGRRLVREFDGVARPLPRDWLKPGPERRPPIQIGRRLEVLSEPRKTSQDAAQLVIPAAGAFGTGEHATTAMTLRLLEAVTRAWPSGWHLFDAGTGTGILALAARRLGAGQVLGIDLDPRAVAHARQNARLNRIRKTKFIATDVLQWPPAARYEVVTANLFSELLIAALPRFQRALRPGGCLILSGILREQAGAVIRALRRARFHLEMERRRGKWVALLATSKS